MPITTMNVRVRTKKAVRIVSMMPVNLGRIHGAIGTLDTAIADGATVTATQVDGAGSASGVALTDDSGNVSATFASSIAAGLWDLSV